MSLATALGAVAGLSFGAGIRKSYTMAEVGKGSINPMTPCLIPIPVTGEVTSVGYGNSSAASFEVHRIKHRYLDSSVPLGDAGAAIARTVGIIDTYLATVQAHNGVSGAIDVRVMGYESGWLDWGGAQYYGCDFLLDVEVCE
jgi:hypothetical protein